MRLFIDTNVIINEQFFRSTRAQTLLKAARFLGVEIVIPEVVVDEVAGRFPIHLAEKLAKFEPAERSLAQLIDLKHVQVSLQDQATKYENWFDNMLDEMGVVVADYPDVPAKTLVIQSYSNKKPFKASGEGYKDFLIWKTIAAAIAAKKDENYFLTNNISDFCSEEGGVCVLHSDLVKDIADEKNVPTIFKSLEKFLSEKISPLLKGVAIGDVPELSNETIRKEAEEIVEQQFNWYGAYGFEGLHFNNDVTAVLTGEPTIEEISLKELNENELIIKVTGRAPIECYGYIDKSDYYSSRDDEWEDIHISDADWNDHVMQVTQTIETPFEILLSYSKADKSITGYSVNLPEELENDWYK